MRKLVLTASGLMATAGVVVAAVLSHPPAPPVAAPDPVPDETAALAEAKGLVWRDGAALSLRLKSGEVLTLTDRRQCGDLPCPREIATHYRYLGWDGLRGGYRLTAWPAANAEMILPFGDDPVLTDARHADPAPGGPLALPPPPAAAPTDDSLADWLGDIAGTRTKLEKPRLQAARGRVVRDGATLTMTLGDGRKLSLTDDLACGQVSCPPLLFRSFDYGGASPDGRFLVVEEQWDEAGAALLIGTAGGAITELVGAPHFSPDGQRAAAAVSDLTLSPPHRLEVWTLGGTTPALEYSVPAPEGDDTIYQVLGWIDADHLHLRRGPWGDTSGQGSDLMLARGSGGWHIETADSGN